MPDGDIQTLDHREFGCLSAELIDNTGGLRFRAHGGSMRPTIRSGDVLTFEKIDPGTLCIGDIVLTRDRAGSLLAHRIIQQAGDTWTTCGDALSTPDIAFKADQLIGRVCRVEHGGRDKAPSKACGRFMAAVSRHCRTLPGRVLKRLFRAC
jgi:hypothetical protein